MRKPEKVGLETSLRIIRWFGTLLLASLTVFSQGSARQQGSDKPAAASPKPDQEIAQKLIKTKRIFVESFGDDPLSKQLYAMVVDSLNQTHRFIITENKEKADAVLKGSALEKTTQETHAIGEGTSVGGAGGSSTSSIKGTAGGDIQGSSSGAFGALETATSDSQASTTTVNDARIAVRLVSSDGDVIWSTTQESKGAKYKGASADVAEKIAKQLVRDVDRVQSAAGEKQPEKK
jgi:hypothetical protein